ncbi:MAG: filamentous hemagglutinin N-terminal domain-containing protein [Candidatus Omnitrophica bacterium]|nr:filamentous hemagglutinin N-terminal domain-containing protein [Candidatus Omnitrophota bacterium]
MSTREMAKNYRFTSVSSLFLPIIIFAVLFFLPAAIVMALPTGEQVEDGSASFERPNEATLNVTTSDKVIIRWNSFDIASHETVNFYQPSATSAALNRIMSGSLTTISGNLNANGTIILVNPAGIQMSPMANIHVGSLIASALNISNADFNSGNYHFMKEADLPPGVIINQGQITVAEEGMVGLFGGKVTNEGKIVAEKGSILLASGNKMTLSFGAFGRSSLVSVTVEEGVDLDPSPSLDGSPSSGVLNRGELSACGGHVVLTAKQVNDVFDLLVNQEGVIKANSAIEHDGIIELIAINGKLRHTGQTLANGTTQNPNAGTVSVQGREIEMSGTVKAESASGGTQGAISILAEGDIRLGHVDMGDTNASIRSVAGSILEAIPGGSLVTAGDIHFDAPAAGRAVGDTSPIQTDVASLTINVGSGGFKIHDIGDVVLGSSQIAPDGSANLSANGTLTLSAPLATFGTGGIDLTANADFDTHGDLTQLPLADMNSAGGAINLTVGNGVVGAGNMYLRTVNAQTGEIILTVSEGSVLAAEGALPLLISGSIDMRGPPSGNGSIGTSSNPIHVRSDYLQATAGSGGISISTDHDISIINLSTSGDLNLLLSSNANLKAGSSNISVGGDWRVLGQFDPGTSTISFVDATRPSYIYGANSFYNFSSTTPDKMLIFEAGKTQTITGTWVIQGSYGHHVKLVSSQPGSQWIVDPQGIRNLSYAWVEDSNNIHPEIIIAVNSTDRGGSSNWDPTVTWIRPSVSGAGNWSDITNWSSGATPGTLDDVLFDGVLGTADSVVDASFTINSLTVTSAYTGQLTINSGFTLTVTTAVAHSGTHATGILINGTLVAQTVAINTGAMMTMGTNSILTLTGFGTPLTGAGSLDTTTNTPNTIQYTGKNVTNITAAGPLSAYYNLSLLTGGMSSDGTITLNSADGLIKCSVIDTAAGFAYFGTTSSPGKIVKVQLSDFTQVGILTLSAGENNLQAAVIDTTGATHYAYFAANPFDGIIVKVVRRNYC